MAAAVMDSRPTRGKFWRSLKKFSLKQGGKIPLEIIVAEVEFLLDEVKRILEKNLEQQVEQEQYEEEEEEEEKVQIQLGGRVAKGERKESV